MFDSVCLQPSLMHEYINGSRQYLGFSILVLDNSIVGMPLTKEFVHEYMCTVDIRSVQHSEGEE